MTVEPLPRAERQKQLAEQQKVNGEKTNAGPRQTSAEEKRQARKAALAPLKWSDIDPRGAKLSLIAGVMPRGSVVLLYARSSHGKSFLAIDWCWHVVAERDWCGRKVEKGSALYIAAEAPASVSLRVHAWAQKHGLSADRDDFECIRVAPNFGNGPNDTDLIVEHIAEAQTEGRLRNLEVIVVDTTSKTIPGQNENDSETMTTLVSNCERLAQLTGATVILLHHMPKASDTPRGHSSLEAGCPIRIEIDKSETGLFTAKIAHQKDGGHEGDRFTFRLESFEVDYDGERLPSAVLMPTDTATSGDEIAPAKRKLTSREQNVFRELANRLKLNRVHEVDRDEWQDIVRKVGELEGCKNEKTKQVVCNRIRRDLLSKGVIWVNDDRTGVVR